MANDGREDLGDVLSEIGLSALRQVVPLIGEAIVAGIAALVRRFIVANPHVPDPIEAVLVRAAGEAVALVREVETLDFGSYFDEDAKKELRFRTAVAELIGRHADRGLVLLRTDAEGLIKQAVATVRAAIPTDDLPRLEGAGGGQS